MNNDLWWQLLRVLLQILGTYLVTRGIITADMGTMLYSDIAIGFIIMLGSAGWGLYVRWRTKAVPVAVVKAKDLPTVSTLTGELVPKPSEVK
jgi:hypothetical protein